MVAVQIRHKSNIGINKLDAEWLLLLEERMRLAVVDLAPHVGCRRVVFLPKRCPTCFSHVADTRKCRVGQGVQNDTTCRLFPTCR